MKSRNDCMPKDCKWSVNQGVCVCVFARADAFLPLSFSLSLSFFLSLSFLLSLSLCLSLALCLSLSLSLCVACALCRCSLCRIRALCLERARWLVHIMHCYTKGMRKYQTRGLYLANRGLLRLAYLRGYGQKVQEMSCDTM